MVELSISLQKRAASGLQLDTWAVKNIWTVHEHKFSTMKLRMHTGVMSESEIVKQCQATKGGTGMTEKSVQQRVIKSKML
jgi:hypothetical protein